MQPGAYDDRHTHVARARHPRSSVVLGVLVLAAVVSTRWVRVNVSPSAPYGLYRLASVPTPLAHGMLVVLPVPPEVQAWHAWWVPLLKPVAAIAGETVCAWEDGLWVSGEWYGPILDHADGKRLIQMVGCHTLQPGEVFLASTQPRSLDSRYFGPIAATALTAQALPLWTWR
jgi:conjugative transfer signal peptidase TraF